MTGERTCPGLAEEAYWFPRHEAAYRWIIRTHGPVRAACDAGSGEGYGGAALRRMASFACGVELDAVACRHAATTYPHVPVVRANLIALPLRDGSFDLVSSMQVIEHMWDVPGYLAELTRILAPGGDLVVSTPNRPVFSPGLRRGERPLNPFHVEEFDAEQVRALLSRAGLVDIEVHGLVHGPRILDWEREHGPLVPALIGSLAGDATLAGLTAFAATVTWQDFRIVPYGTDESGDAHDLIALGRAPAVGRTA